MTVKISWNGSILKYNKNNNLHSFNGKPAHIAPNGRMYWYDNGKAYKIQSVDGTVTSLHKDP